MKIKPLDPDTRKALSILFLCGAARYYIESGSKESLEGLKQRAIEYTRVMDGK